MASFRIADEKLESLIQQYCRDYTARVQAGKTEPIIGRDDEIDQILTILLQKGRSNAVLLGGAGVGKTAAFVALARHLVLDNDNLPPQLQNARVLEIDFSMVAAGAESKGEFLGRLVPLIEGVAERNESQNTAPIIFVVDELHSVMSSAMSADASNNNAAGVGDLMKPYLTTGNLRIVGATTNDEFNLYIKTDPALERRFQKVHLKEPSRDETIAILLGLKKNYEKHFRIEIPDKGIERIVDLTIQFMRNRNNPDKSLMVLDGACARSVRSRSERLTLDAVAQTIGAETGIDPNALQN